MYFVSLMRDLLDFKKIWNGILLRFKKWVGLLQMTKLRRIEISRDVWREKARARADELREGRKVRRRDREKILSLRDEVNRLRDELKKKSSLGH